MDELYDYKRYGILYVDDEEKSLKYFKRAFDPSFQIWTAANARDGFELLKTHQDSIALLLTDQQMPGEKGVQLLEKARRLRPRILRVLVTAYSDIDAAVEAVNSGAIYKYISKPWDMTQLEVTLRRALEFFMVQQERDHLLREKLSVLHNVMITDRVLGLGVLAAGMGHHIRNSLMAVRTFLDLAPGKLEEEEVNLESLRNPNFWKDFYVQVQGQVTRITQMLNDLTEATEERESPFKDEIQPGQFLSDIVNRVRDQFASKDIQIELSADGDLPSMRVERKKFERLFELLLQDEAANVRSGGRISLSVTPVSLEGKSGDWVQFDVKDTGPRLPEAALRSVFDPFFARRDDPQEFGIRLMTCFFIVYHHGGRIDVKAEGDEGTTFSLKLPVNPSLDIASLDENDFISKVLLNDSMWDRLLSGE